MRGPIALLSLVVLAACSDPTAVDPPQFLIGGSALRPLSLEYVKTETGPGTAQWTGSVSGDVSGDLQTQVLSLRVSDHIWHIETFWQVSAGGQSFEASLVGTLDVETGELLLNGRVVSGYLSGARVHNEGQLTGFDPGTGGTVFEGFMRIMPGSAR